MAYFFILGSNPTLSLAEIAAVCGYYKEIRISDGVLLLKTDESLRIDDVMQTLGGTVKMGVIFDTVLRVKTEFIVNKIKNDLQPGSGKFKFGLSYYGHKKLNLKPIGMEIKKHLKEKQVSCRWVTSRDQFLSSVVVEQNKLTSEGIEICLIEDSGKLHLGRTLAVQPFKSLSFRDYGRPSRDDRSGMLPPKLAKIMVNLAGISKDGLLLDPFCGSGTVLTEAMLMGYKKLQGSDISDKALRDSQDNINWIKDKFHINTPSPLLRLANANALSKHMSPASVDAIVTEPFLGEQRGGFDLKKQISELESRYTEALREFKKIIKPQGIIVMLFPVFFNKHIIKPSLNGYRIISPIPEPLRKSKQLKLTQRDTIVYGRSGQRVWREIVLLKKL